MEKENLFYRKALQTNIKIVKKSIFSVYFHFFILLEFQYTFYIIIEQKIKHKTLTFSFCRTKKFCIQNKICK